MSIVNTDELTFILTNTGLRRIAEAIEDKTVTLNLSKIKLGDANGEYYEPIESMTELKNPIENGEFYVLDKELLEDGVTVSFHISIPETFGNCDIREVGLYETINGVDELFAIGTQQPFVKPSVDYNYFIAIDYYLFLKSANLSSVYEQIILNPDNQLVTEQQLQDLLSTILFTQGNLSEQIGKNSHIIGLDRADTLYEMMSKTTENYGYTFTYENYATLLSYVNPNNVFGYWVFNYPRRVTITNSIVDISKNNYNFSTNKSINLYNRNYFGFMPMLSFSEGDYFFLPAQVPLTLVDENNQDIPFTMVFAITPHSLDEKRTLLAKSNYATDAHAFEVNELTNGSIEVILFSDSSNYMTFTSGAGLIKEGEAHSLILSYNPTDKLFNAYLNGNKISLSKTVTGTYTHLNITPTILYAFTYTPFEAIYASTSTTPITTLYNKDGSVYTGTDWTLKDGKALFGTQESSYDSTKNVTAGPLYAWTCNDGVEDHTIYTRETTISRSTILYNSDFSKYNGKDYTIIMSGSTYIIQYIDASTATAVTMLRDSAKDVAMKTMYAWVCNKETVVIWANDNVEPTILLNSNGDLYTGTDWTLNNKVITYKGFGTGVYTSSRNITLPTLGSITSYVIDKDGSVIQTINSNVGLVSIIIEGLTDDEERTFALELEAQMGKNPCFSR